MALGEIGWSVIRATLYAIGFMVVILVLGLVASPWAIFAVPAATLLAFAFGAAGMAATTFMRTWQDFDLIQLVVLPLFLFSGTFYPITSYPPLLQLFVQVTPLYQGVDLIRSLVIGDIGPTILVHVVYLTVMGFAGCGSCRSASTGSCSSSDRPVASGRCPTPIPSVPPRAARDLPMLDAAIADCFACPRLVAWREEQARVKVARFRDETVLGRPVPGLRDPATRGSCSSGSRRRRTAATAPAACSRATPRATSCGARCTPSGLADRPVSRRADDGLTLNDVRIAAAVRCAPPANKPTPEEQATCRPYLVREIELLAELRVIVALGAIGWDAALRTLAALGQPTPQPEAPLRPRRRDDDRPVHARSAPTTRASRTPSPAG